MSVLLLDLAGRRVRDLWLPISGALLTGLAALPAVATVQRVRSRRIRKLLANGPARSDADEVAARFSQSAELFLRRVLKAAVADVAEEQDLPPAVVRGNIFGLDRTDGRLRIVDGLTVNMERDAERRISMSPGEGSTGVCFVTGRPHIAVYTDVVKDSTISSLKERARADPDLCWIISTPIRCRHGETLWVLNVDGRIEPRTAEKLSQSVALLIYWAEYIAVSFAAFAGDQEPVRQMVG